MRTWLVTGASKGLGSAIARTVLAHGDRVALAARGISQDDPVLADYPDTALPVTLDLTDLRSIKTAIRKVEDWGGSIDVLVNNAGQGIFGAIEETSDQELRRLFDVNFFGVAATVREVLPAMRQRGDGLIINIGSVAGFVANPGTGAYCATKFALEALTEALRKEVAQLGIRVSMAAPGGMRTGFNGSSIWEVGKHIDAYDVNAGARARDLRRAAGQSGTDVRAAAQAIWELAQQADPPSHLILGADAILRIEQKIALLQERLADARPLTEGIDHMGAAAASEN